MLPDVATRCISTALILMRLVSLQNFIATTFKESPACLVLSAAPIRTYWNRHSASTLVVTGKHSSHCDLVTVSRLFPIFGTLRAYGGAHVYADQVVIKFM